MDPLRQARAEHPEGRADHGVSGDPTKATPEPGKMFIGFKIDNEVTQINQLLAAQKK